MSLNAVQVDPDVITKAEFARRRGVSPGRVSQWISEGKITGEAIVGQGRNAQIRESVAVAQLRNRLDPMQMAGNGLGTSLKPPTAVAPAPPPSADILPFGPLLAAASSSTPAPPQNPVFDTIEDRIKAQRLEQIERQNRKDERQEAIDAGRLVDADTAKRAATREAARLVTMFEGALSNFATAVAAEFKQPQRDVLHLLRIEFRKLRAGAASEATAKAQAMPATIEIELGADADADEMESV